MEGALVTAATGVLGPVIAKLAHLLGTEYKLRHRTRSDINLIKSKCKSMHSLLVMIWEREDLDEESRKLKMEALDLADDMEDATDDFILGMERSVSNKHLIQKKINKRPFQDLKKRATDVSRRCRRKWKRMTAQPICSMFSLKKAQGSAPIAPYVRRDASQLVGMVTPKGNLIRYLLPDQFEPQFRMASIAGMAGMGKTTLARLVYEEIQDKFQARAFVSVTPGGNMKKLLTNILQQVAPDSNSTASFLDTKAAAEEHLVGRISDFLKDRRYLVMIDDIWHCGEWETIRKCFPENDLGSRIVTTSRIDSVAQKWRDDTNALVHEVGSQWDAPDKSTWDEKRSFYVAFGDHPFVHVCGGMPLAIHCMLSAKLKEREKQGLNATDRDLSDTIVKQVIQKGIHNTPGLEPLVESLQLDYDNLTDHRLKTCLLYCSMYPEDHNLEIQYVIRRWVAERFVYKEEEAKVLFEDLVNRRLLILMERNTKCDKYYYRLHPMMRNFLRWKSREDNFITWSSDLQPSDTSRIRRLFVDNLPCMHDGGEQVVPLCGFELSHIRSLVVLGCAERVPFQRMERLRVLDVAGISDLRDHHLKKNVCGLVRLRHLLGLNGDGITEIPPEIARLQRLETLEVFRTKIKCVPGVIANLEQLMTLAVPRNGNLVELPREIGGLQQLRSLDTSETEIRELPKDIGKLQRLEQLLSSETQWLDKIPRGLWRLKELKVLKLDGTTVSVPLEACRVLKLVGVGIPECIHQAWKRDLMSSLAGEMLSFETSCSEELFEGGLVVGAKNMHIPGWIREHFNDLAVLDIRICILDEGGLKILREMPNLRSLTLRFEVVPRNAIAISGEGFAKLDYLLVDSRVPRITFQEGAMPNLEIIYFQFQFYTGPVTTKPMGIKHLRSLSEVYFGCSKWYRAESIPCISATINVVSKEVREHPNIIYFSGFGDNGEWCTEFSGAESIGEDDYSKEKGEFEEDCSDENCEIEEENSEANSQDTDDDCSTGTSEVNKESSGGVREIVENGRVEPKRRWRRIARPN
ncbi:disease resistance protein PIK5-NP-like [Lolium rigidum]|uniref:disease resistance protein PIK5-NP-like n=1 Tax=Lolium rigidum TaxID=89674 RepID=UPI001F5E1C6F|nr:disease resistance protein PIK5-NP-like [Lolium rigidum]